MASERDTLTTIRDLVSARLVELDGGPVVPPPPQAETRAKDAIELRAALKRGGLIHLEPGAYVGNWVLDADGTVLVGARDAILAPADALEPTLWGLAHDARAEGFTVANGAPDRECLVIGRYDATEGGTQPSRVTLSGLLVQAGAQGGHRGIALHGAFLTVSHCDVLGFWEVGRDSQAIWIHNGPGPYLVEDCQLEASGESLLLGGADPAIPGCIPSDVTIRRNVLRKPIADYALKHAQVKCSFEVKNGRRVLFDSNVIDGFKPGLQQSPIQITPRNQDGTAPWANADDVTITNTVYRNVVGGFAVNVQGTDNEHPSAQIAKLTIAHNLFLGSTALLQLIGGITDALVIDHNTAPSITSKVFSFDRVYGTPNVVTPLTFMNNVLKAGTYGVTGDGSTAIGLPSLLAFCRLVDWSGNLLASNATIPWPAGQAVIPPSGLLALLDPQTYKTLQGTAGY